MGLPHVVLMHLCLPGCCRRRCARLQMPVPRGAWDDSAGFVALTKYATAEARAALEAGMLQSMASGYLAYAAAGALLRWVLRAGGGTCLPSGCCLPPTACPLAAACRLPSGCRLPPADCRLPSAACRHHVPHFHCKLPPVSTLHCFWTAPTAALAQVPGVGQRAGADGGQPGGAPPGQRNTHAHRCSHCGSAGAHPYHQGGHLLSQAQRHEPVQVRQLWVLRLDRSMASAVCSCRARSGL